MFRQLLSIDEEYQRYSDDFPTLLKCVKLAFLDIFWLKLI